MTSSWSSEFQSWPVGLPLTAVLLQGVLGGLLFTRGPRRHLLVLSTGPGTEQVLGGCQLSACSS